MPLPYSFKNKIENTKKRSKENFLAGVRNLTTNSMYNDLSENNNEISFVSKNSLVFFSYKVTINYANDKVEYEIFLVNLIILIVVLFTASAFFTNLNFNDFIWAGLTISIIFYFVNLFYVNNQVKTLINRALLNTDDTLDEENARTYMDDASRCPACGHPVTMMHEYCPDCGLKLPGKRKKSPFNITKYEGKNINYSYKEKNNKK